MLIFLSGTLYFWNYKSKQSSQLEQLSVQISWHIPIYSGWCSVPHSSRKTHPYEYQTCYVSSSNMWLCCWQNHSHLQVQWRRTSNVEPICFCCSGKSPSSPRLPGCSAVRSSPFLVWWFKVRINRCCWVLCIRILCHHFQLRFNGFYLCSNTGKRKRDQNTPGYIQKTLSSSPYTDVY